MSSGPLSLERRLDAGKQLDRPQVDVLVELKPQLQQQALFEDARLDVGMADGAQVDGVELAQLVDGAGGQHFAGAQVALAAEVEVGQFVLELVAGRRRPSETLSPSAATSGPVPSPPITAMRSGLLGVQ